MYQFDPQLDIKQWRIVLVGCGGTGSAIASYLARLLFHLKDRNMDSPHSVHFIDPDSVEAKNVGRQSFAPSDVGQDKAYIVARRLNLGYGLNIQAHVQRFSSKQLERYNSHNRSTIILGAVDNHFARREIAKLFSDNGNEHHSSNSRYIWIDAGNHRTNGQVIIGNNASREYLDTSRKQLSKEKASKVLPAPHLVMPELLEAEKKNPAETNPTLSCAELLMLDEQDLFINQNMALMTMQYLKALILHEPIYHYMSYVSGFNSRSILISPEIFPAKSLSQSA